MIKNLTKVFIVYCSYDLTIGHRASICIETQFNFADIFSCMTALAFAA
jgi:hypothetical protein